MREDRLKVFVVWPDRPEWKPCEKVEWHVKSRNGKKHWKKTKQKSELSTKGNTENSIWKFLNSDEIFPLTKSKHTQFPENSWFTEATKSMYIYYRQYSCVCASKATQNTFHSWWPEWFESLENKDKKNGRVTGSRAWSHQQLQDYSRISDLWSFHLITMLDEQIQARTLQSTGWHSNSYHQFYKRVALC